VDASVWGAARNTALNKEGWFVIKGAQEILLLLEDGASRCLDA
jgi:hypothetical protein